MNLSATVESSSPGMADICFIARTRDISASGAFISTHYFLPVGTPVHLGVSLKSSGAELPTPGPQMSAEGIVVRETSEGMGIRFLEERPSDQLSLILSDYR